MISPPKRVLSAKEPGALDSADLSKQLNLEHKNYKTSLPTLICKQARISERLHKLGPKAYTYPFDFDKIASFFANLGTH